MSQPEVYQEIKDYLSQYLRPGIGSWTLDRLTVMVSGMLKAQHSAPARIAEAGQGLSERGTQAASIERRLRRIENDARIEPGTCFWPLVKALLKRSAISELILAVDATTQEDRVVMVSINAYYRGRSLPLAWTIWPGNQILEGAGFWERVAALLAQVKALIPPGVRVTVLADRAFGSPAFTDLVTAQGWHWLVRLQGQTRCRDRCGHELPVEQLAPRRGRRGKRQGQLFKKAGWRSASVVAHWGARHATPLCLASDRQLSWDLITLYRRRFPIEPTFRDWKSAGWHWEQCQVTALDHLERLILGMALATWLTLLVGARQAQALLAQPVSGQHRSRPNWAKRSLFQLGLQLWRECFAEGLPPWLGSVLPGWQAPNWSMQITAHYANARPFS